tara:strand:+ start:1815 stop:2090 length:276 start_codon:yes stop_codon:yes gene_type:complete
LRKKVWNVFSPSPISYKSHFLATSFEIKLFFASLLIKAINVFYIPPAKTFIWIFNFRITNLDKNMEAIASYGFRWRLSFEFPIFNLGYSLA